MSIKDGCSTSFWTDNWVDNGESLLDLACEDGPEIDSKTAVAEFGTSSGEWNIPKHCSCLLEDVVLQVLGIQPPRVDSREDIMTWGSENDGHFRVRSAYEIRKWEVDRDADID
ncbi:unnamed protein product [Linum trigynum]|uniref:Uncharacterized protein n=1 Tax=Linum trigynum TaxID=586398 RepID=A0AAV2EMY5_9ROSI